MNYNIVDELDFLNCKKKNKKKKLGHGHWTIQINIQGFLKDHMFNTNTPHLEI